MVSKKELIILVEKNQISVESGLVKVKQENETDNRIEEGVSSNSEQEPSEIKQDELRSKTELEEK